MRRLAVLLLAVLLLAGCASSPLPEELPEPVVTPQPLTTQAPTPLPTDTPRPVFRYAAEEPLSGERLDRLTRVLGLAPEYIPFTPEMQANTADWPEAELYLLAPEDFTALRQLVSEGKLRTLPRYLYRQLGEGDALLDEYLPAWGNGNAELLALPSLWWGESRSYDTGILYFRGDWEDSLFPDNDGDVTWTAFIERLRGYKNASTGSEYGISTAGWELLTLLSQDFGVRDWVLEEGIWVPGVTSNRMKEAFGWLRQLYREELLAGDFFLRTDQDALTAYVNGEAGMLLTRNPEALYTALDITEAEERVSTWPLPVTPYARRYVDGGEPKTVAAFGGSLSDESLLALLTVLSDFGEEAEPASEAMSQYLATVEEDYAAFDWHSPLFARILPATEVGEAQTALEEAWQGERMTLLLAGNYEEAWTAWVARADALPDTATAAEAVNAWAELLRINREE